MPEHITYTYFLEAIGGTVGNKKVMSAHFNMIIDRILILFQSGSAFKLSIVFYVGNTQFVPDSGDIRGDGHVVELFPRKPLPEGFDLMLRYSNEDTSNQFALIIIEASEVEGET